MSTEFETEPVLSSPYFKPEHHWVLDKYGRPTGKKAAGRRPSEYMVPVPVPVAKEDELLGQIEIPFEAPARNDIINLIRSEVEKWRGGGGIYTLTT